MAKGERVRLTPTDDLMYLRQKEGMTRGKIAQCIHLLELMGDPSAAEAEQMIIQALDELLTDERIAPKIKALRITLAIDPIFEPDDPRSVQESQFNLDQRQIEYGQVIYRGKDTIKLWEKAAIKELLALLATQAVPHLDEIMVSGVVIGRQLMWHALAQNGEVVRALDLTGELSLPMLVYQSDEPALLSLRIHFKDEVPRRVWQTEAGELWLLAAGSGARELRQPQPIMKLDFGETSPGWYYAVCWQY